MNIIKRATLEAFWTRHPETEQALKEWFQTARTADWSRMDDVMRAYPRAKVLNGERARFEICGGNYRLIVAFKFTARIAFIKFIGTHAEYDRVDALTVDQY
ncbi:type II toxin-antitoxin system HigB family toxin [Aerophototrophica crusticola]|uniref:Type II toxin-antitoxin system HigB family toxin n=1 Tax=Aerophototrophica crusticola TaxID=1709002 RepID=A0A858R8B0_9PROT|nr:type II toxin-antitoxin system HigB family toxin [Rhodospirillaceae bacterium B3]